MDFFSSIYTSIETTVTGSTVELYTSVIGAIHTPFIAGAGITFIMMGVFMMMGKIELPQAWKLLQKRG